MESKKPASTAARQPGAFTPLQLLQRAQRHPHAQPGQEKSVVALAQRRVAPLQYTQQRPDLAPAEQLRGSIKLDIGSLDPRGRVEARLAMRVDLFFIAAAVKSGHDPQRVVDRDGCVPFRFHPGDMLLDIFLIQLPRQPCP